MDLPRVITKEEFEHQKLIQKNENCIRLVDNFNNSILCDKPNIPTKTPFVGDKYPIYDIKCAVDHIEKNGWKVDYEKYDYIYFKSN